MDIHVTDDRIGRYFRRRELGLRLLSHGARPSAVLFWTGLTRDELMTLRRRWNIPTRHRRRGPSPYSFEGYFRSTRMRSRATAFASLCQLIGLIPEARGNEAAKRLPSLEAAELLCEALELFKESEPAANYDFEQAALIATGIVKEKEVKLGRCTRCNAAKLIDLLELPQPSCAYCRQRGRQPIGASMSRQPRDEGPVQDDADAETARGRDCLPEGKGGTDGGDFEDDGDEEA